jgi:hypothetical protein
MENTIPLGSLFSKKNWVVKHNILLNGMINKTNWLVENNIF